MKENPFSNQILEKSFGTQEHLNSNLENSRNTFHIFGKICSKNTDIFIYNVARGEGLDWIWGVG